MDNLQKVELLNDFIAKSEAEISGNFALDADGNVVFDVPGVTIAKPSADELTALVNAATTHIDGVKEQTVSSLFTDLGVTRPSSE